MLGFLTILTVLVINSLLKFNIEESEKKITRLSKNVGPISENP
jgi:hypothetical protein